MGLKNKENFIYHYKLETSANRCACGPGSESKFLKGSGTIDFIGKLINRYNIKSINDCGCGLFENWMCLIDLSEIKYIGYDINPLAIARNKFKFPEYEFFEFDIVNEITPYADLIICRDCLFHLPNDFNIKALNNFRKSKAKYLLSTEHDWLKSNKDLTSEELENEAGFRLLNLEIEPYNLGKPLEIHFENIKPYFPEGNNRQMSLWRINE